MRHQHKGYKLGRTHAHREATLAALSSALIEHKSIRTTITKAKALRMYIEPLVTRSKVDSTHNRREVFRHLQNKKAVTELFTEVASKVGDRRGGYTRVIKLGPRPGDAAEMAVIEFVDFNEAALEEATTGRSRRTRRGGSRRGRSKRTEAGAATAAAASKTAEPAVEEDAAEQDAGVVDAEAIEAPELEQAKEADIEASDVEEIDASDAEADQADTTADEEPAEGVDAEASKDDEDADNGSEKAAG